MPAVALPGNGSRALFERRKLFSERLVFALVRAWRQAGPALEGAGKDALRLVAAILGDLYQGLARFQLLGSMGHALLQ